MLTTYSDRAASDKNRLSEMMHYAETPSCRAQVVRAYFDEPAGEPCGRCDNCAAGKQQAIAGKASHSAAVLALEAAEGAAPAPAAHREEVHTVETLHGSYQTTRDVPEAVPDSAFQPGDRVSHDKFGPGKVLEVVDDTLLIDFATTGEKRLRADFVSAA